MATFVCHSKTLLRSSKLLAHVARQFSTAQVARLQLAYDLHEPPKEKDKSKWNKPIVFIHGLFGSKKNNRSMSKVLARDLTRPVYAIDLRNHGDSPHDPKHDYGALGQDVEDFIEQHGLGESTIIGHSMGAKTAMTVALHNPTIVETMISVDNAPLDAVLHSDFGKYVEGMRKIDAARVQKQSDAEEILKEYEEASGIRLFLLQNLARVKDNSGEQYQKFRIPLKTLGNSLDLMADFPYKDPEEVRFEKPALFVRGSESKYVADEALPVVGQFFPKFELVEIKSGHWVISENPEAFREAVVRFLTSSHEGR